MSFYQNPFPVEFRGSLLLSDRQYTMNFVCPANQRGLESVSTGVDGPYNLSGVDANGDAVTTLNFKYTNDGRNWIPLSVSGISNAASVTATQIVATLNADAGFAANFTATVIGSASNKIKIDQKKSDSRMKFYVENGKLESVLKFNKLAPVVEMPQYFDRHVVVGGKNLTGTIGTPGYINSSEFPDTANMLVYLDPSDPVSAAVITAAGLDPASPQADWQLLRGRSGAFKFQKITLDVSGNITRIIEFPAGAKAGDLGKRTDYTGYGAGTKATQITEVPYVVREVDITGGSAAVPPAL